MACHACSHPHLLDGLPRLLPPLLSLVARPRHPGICHHLTQLIHLTRGEGQREGEGQSEGHRDRQDKRTGYRAWGQWWEHSAMTVPCSPAEMLCGDEWMEQHHWNRGPAADRPTDWLTACPSGGKTDQLTSFFGAFSSCTAARTAGSLLKSPRSKSAERDATSAATD